MVATRELAEAQTWSRRRLAHVLVVGPEGVRGEEARRPGRAVLGGAVLAALLVAGVGVAGLVRAEGAPTSAPEDPALGVGVAVAAETGATYVVLAADGPAQDGSAGGLVARAVLNPTSARLLLPDGAGAATPQTVPAAELAALAAQAPGPAVGIADAPPAVPPAADLTTSGWVVCPADTAPPALPARPPDPLGAGTALLVTADGVAHLVVDAGDGARRYPLPVDPTAAEASLAALGAPPLATALPVPPAWLVLVPPGTSTTLPPLAVRSGPTCLLLEPGAPGRPASAPTTRLAAPTTDGPTVTPPGAGALVTTPGRTRARWFVDDRGRALPVVGTAASARLGWAEALPVVVSTAWLALLEPGPVLSVRSAATPVAGGTRPGTARGVVARTGGGSRPRRR